MFGSVKRLRRRAVVLLTAMLTSLALVIPAAPARAVSSGVYSVAYSDSLYLYYGYGSPNQLTYDQWRSYGFQRPTRINSDYVKYPWSDQIYAVTFFDTNQDSWMWQLLDFSSWARAGYPQPRVAGWIYGSTYYRYAGDQTIYVSLNGQEHRLTYQEWVAAGLPNPTVRNQYMKLSWDDTIVKYQEYEGRLLIYSLGYQSWAYDGFPAPQVRPSLPGDYICKYSWSDTLFYYGSSHFGALTWGQWAATDFMAPRSC